jgi:hypothetical protein
MLAASTVVVVVDTASPDVPDPVIICGFAVVVSFAVSFSIWMIKASSHDQPEGSVDNTNG